MCVVIHKMRIATAILLTTLTASLVTATPITCCEQGSAGTHGTKCHRVPRHSTPDHSAPTPCGLTESCSMAACGPSQANAPGPASLTQANDFLPAVQSADIGRGHLQPDLRTQASLNSGALRAATGELYLRNRVLRI